MPACKVCQSKDINYRCRDCGDEFCFKHTGSTDVFTCKNHPIIRLNRVQAEERNNRCQIVERSRCPTCGSSLEIKMLNNGQMYLACVQCTWNSRQNTPIIMGLNEKAVLKEAEKYRLAKDQLCREKFRRNKGREFCTSCFIRTLKNNVESTFSAIQSQYGINEAELTVVLKELIANNAIKGNLDLQNKSFIYFPPNLEETIVAELQSQGSVELATIAQRFNVGVTAATRIMIDLIRKNSLRGTFDSSKNRYYLEGGLTQLLLNEIQAQGKIVHADLSSKYKIPDGNIKNYIMNMMKNKLIDAYFYDNGNATTTVAQLEEDIETFCNKNGIFLVNSLASHLKVAPELARRTLFGLIQKGAIRGIFTQNHEFITEDTLSEKIKAIARAYRTVSITDLAKKLAITEQRVEEGLATLISRGSVAGYIDMGRKVFIADEKQPITKISSFGPTGTSQGTSAAIPPPPSEGTGPKGDIEVVREYDFVGGQLHFKVVVRNKSNMAIHDIKVILDVPSSYRRAKDLLNISVIDPGNTHGVDFYLEPAECGISSIGGTVLYKDAMGKMNTIHIDKKDIQIKCPLVIKTLDTIEDCQKAIQSLPSDARAFLISDLPPQMAYSAAYRAISQFDTRNVASLEDDKSGNYEAEAWFSSEAKVTGGRIITRIYYNGSTSTLEVRVWCNDAGQLTGFLAKIIELLFVEINMMRRVKAEERSKTLDVMVISRSIVEVEDICMLRYKASSAKLKLEDIHARLTRVTCNCDDISQKIYDWIKKLEGYSEEAMINDEDAEALEKDMQGIHQALQIQLGA